MVRPQHSRARSCVRFGTPPSPYSASKPSLPKWEVETSRLSSSKQSTNKGHLVMLPFMRSDCTAQRSPCRDAPLSTATQSVAIAHTLSLGWVTVSVCKL